MDLFYRNTIEAFKRMIYQSPDMMTFCSQRPA